MTLKEHIQQTIGEFDEQEPYFAGKKVEEPSAAFCLTLLLAGTVSLVAVWVLHSLRLI